MTKQVLKISAFLGFISLSQQLNDLKEIQNQQPTSCSEDFLLLAVTS